MTTTWLRADRAIIGDGKTFIAPAWLEIEREQIKTLTNEKPSGVNEQVVMDFGNATLTPGLINLHDHISRKILRDKASPHPSGKRSKDLMAEPKEYLFAHCIHNAQAALKEGITWIQDYGLAGRCTIHLKRVIKEGLIKGPEICSCGLPICMTGGHTYAYCQETDGPYEVMKAVRTEIKAGADIIKFMASGGLAHFPQEDPKYPEFTVEELKAGIGVAHDSGILTAAHAYPTAAILRILEAGIDSVHHGVMLTEACIKLMVEKKASLVPTMSGLQGPYYLPDANPEDLKNKDILIERIFEPHAKSVKNAVDAGILVGTGTDSFGKLADEIRLIGDAAGDTPIQALARATGIAAKIAARTDIGLLDAGKRADIAVFPGDLTVSLNTLNKAIQVWVKGKAMLINPNGNRRG
jgi:imidazolonepropionase-like amidohydrolase